MGAMTTRRPGIPASSPAVVAASAIAGKIDFPGEWDNEPVKFTIRENEPAPPGRSPPLLEGFPERITGELVFCHQDNLNTDGIYPSKYTYEDLSPDEQAAVVMQNYDPTFIEKVREGDILVGGFNFGTGSSREQAATSLKYKGIQVVIAGSFSQTYRRNAFNNGFLTLEVPSLVRDLKQSSGTADLTVRTGTKARLDFPRGTLTVGDREYRLVPPGKVVQELILVGGIENWVRKRLGERSSPSP